MRCFTAAEIKLSSFTIGGLEFIWASVISLDPNGRLSMLLQLYDLRMEFVSVLSVAGALLMAGSIFPWRKMRHVGLCLSPLVTFPTFGVLIGHGLTGALSFSLPFLGIMSLVTFFMDAKRKPRATMDN